MLPKKLGFAPGTTLFLMRGYDGCLELHTEESFEKHVETVSKLSLTKSNARLHSRLTIGSGVDVKVDNQGRIQIPAFLMGKYHLQRETYLIGVYDHIEIWDKVLWDEYESSNEGEFEKNAQSLLSEDK